MVRLPQQGFIDSFKNIVLLFFSVASICFGQSAWESVRPYPQRQSLHAVTFGNGKFVAVGELGSIVTSTNGKDWISNTIITTIQSDCFYSVAYGNNRFVATTGSLRLGISAR
jgi:hypothetical protein